MANWTTPRDWSAGETLTAAYMNAQLRDNLKAAFPVGKWDYFGQAATTGETLINGAWLECNGVSVLRATYPELNTYLSALGYPYGTADGTHMTLPDGQARAPYGMASGGHADVNAIGDNDAVTKTSRSPKHNTSAAGLTVTGAPSIGTLAVGVGTLAGTVPVGNNFGGGTHVKDDNGSTSRTQAVSLTGAPSLSGAPGLGSLDVGGSGGPGDGGRPNDLAPWIIGGVWAIKVKS